MICKRRKAFIGTAISLGANIVGGIVGNQKKKRAEEAQLQYQADINQAKSATSVAQNMTNARSNDYSNSLENRRLYTSSLFKKGGEIYIKPSKRGTFTEAAKKRGQSVQGFASKVLANKDNYSSAMVKKANFARNATKWKHLLGGVNNLFKYGGSSKFSKRPTKQNLGLESPNKTGKNSPTAYRSPSNASSVVFLSTLRSDDKVVQKALESLTSSSPVKERDARTSYRTGGEVKQRQLGDSPYDDPTFAFTRKRFDIRKNVHSAKNLNVSTKGFRTIKALSKTLRSASPILEFLQNTIPSKESEYAEEIKNGGTTSINPIIQEGGDAIKLKPNTFLLRGRKHRNGGIVIGKGRNSIEAEGGEVVKIDKNQMKILSTVPMANGESPAARVVKGENPDKVFQSQENFKDMNNLSNKKYKCGGKVQRRKAALGDWLNVAGDAFNMISPLIGGRRTKRAINRMIAPSQPQQLQTANLRTTYNISPQLTESRQAEREAIAETSANTASSVASQARNMRIRNLGLGQRNQLLGQKENIETQLMNQAALNRQQVTNQNISATNDWRDRVAQFVNDQIVSSANVDNQMIEGVTSGIRDIQSRFDKNRQERNALTATMAANPEQVELFMKKRKEYENLLDKNSNSLLRPYYLGGLKNKRNSKVK